MTLRMEADRPTTLVSDGGDEFKLSPRGTRVQRGRLGELPWPLPSGFVPLMVLIVESGGISWRWQLPVVSPGAPPKP